jgi:glycosyltransferase involved in cell wall biosynthesis
VIVVDDGSRDNTTQLATSAGATVLRHVINLGKGASMKTGAEYAIQYGAQAIIFVDGDGQHDPKLLKEFISKLRKYDIVFGFRRRNNSMPAVLRFGNWFLSIVIKRLYGMNLHDSQCGYRALTRRAYEAVRWRSTDYSVESEMIANAGKHDLRYAEQEIPTVYHDKYKGTTPLDGIPIVLRLFWWRFTR